MLQYFLMHKNQECGTLILDERFGRILEYHDNRNGMSPYLGTANIEKIRQWWELRAVPSSRAAIQQVLNAANCFNTEVYLAKNLGLSMTDTYWIKPMGVNLSFDDVKFTNIATFTNGKIPYHNATSYDPNASLGGQMEKYWDLAQSTPTLVKESYKYFGQQSINEVFATMLHERQDTRIPFVKYSASKMEDLGIKCRCPAFTSEYVELLSANELLESQKTNNEQSLYDKFISVCVDNGLDRYEIQDFMDYQTMTDFIISNVDEHLNNFGVLRDTDTMNLIGPAPIFDSGNSMFYNDDRKMPYTRAGILEIPIAGFYKSEEKMLKKVKNRNLVKIDLLPTVSEVKEFYTSTGIPEEKANIISKNYETKLQLFSEFQKGKSISLYNEKKTERANRYNKKMDFFTQKQKFIMVCGAVEFIGTEFVYSLYTNSELKHLDSSNLYPIEKAIEKTDIIFDASKITNDINNYSEYKNSIVFISQRKIQQELIDNYPNKYSSDLALAVINARIKTAFKSGASVIYEAVDLDKNSREKCINIATEFNISSTELHVIWAEPNNSSNNTLVKILQAINTRLKFSNPSKSEGWDKIVEHKIVSLAYKHNKNN